MDSLGVVLCFSGNVAWHAFQGSFLMGKTVTLNEKIIAVIAYENPNNDLNQNISTMYAVYKVLQSRKKEALEMINNTPTS